MGGWQKFKNIVLGIGKQAIMIPLKGLGGILGWVASFFGSIAWNKYIEPILRLGFRKIKKILNLRQAKKAAKKLKEADTDEKVNNAIDDIT